VDNNASPKSGDVYLEFNGHNAYVEIPSHDDYSVSTTGELTIAVWLRPETLNFPAVEKDKDYIHWLGKGEGSGAEENQEWTFRMYNHDDLLETPPRTNRISFYLFNPPGRKGVGSFVQVPISIRQWMHIVSVVDSSRTYIYKDGQYIRCDTYRGPAQGSCEIHYQDPPNQNLQLVINPEAGPAPLRFGTKDRGSFFEGGLTRVRIWNRVLPACEIAMLYSADVLPKGGLVAEFLLNANTGTTAVDTAKKNNGKIFDATWARQR
jgi:hypothetical protein